MISSSVCAFWVEIATTGRVCVSRQRSKALLTLLPQPRKVSISAGCFPVSSTKELNSSVEPRSETPSRRSGFGGTRDTAAPAGAAKRSARAVAARASQSGGRDTARATGERGGWAKAGGAGRGRLRGCEYIAHPSGLDHEGLRVGRAALADHRDLHQLG